MAEPSSQCSFADLVQSELFTFYIGEERKPFVVHSSAIAATSEHFRALVNGDLVEAKTRCAELSDVEPDDFVRFLEYAYRGDYTVPPWEQDTSPYPKNDDDEAAVDEPPPPRPDDEPLVESNQVPVAVEEPAPSIRPTKLKRIVRRKEDKTTLRSSFHTRTYTDESAPNSQLSKGFGPKSNSAPDQDFRPVLLAHARLYMFADMRLIYPLKNLALQKMHKTLMKFELYHQRVGDIVELARFAYDNGPDRSEAGTVNDLRYLVVEYMACEVDTIGRHKKFKALLEDGGELVGDFWGIVTKYLV